MMKESLAEKGLFNQPHLTPLQSVERTPLYDVLFNLNLQVLKANEKES